MKKIKLYIAMSLNGKIAEPDGSVDWLESMPNPEKLDYGFGPMYESIDTTIQGYKTYELILKRGIGIPSVDKKNYVITRKQDVVNTPHVEFIKQDHVSFIRQLKKQDGKDIWLMGGGQINTMFLNEGLIDEMQVYIMPIVVSVGIGLFEFVPNQKMIELTGSFAYPTGVVELRYRVG